MKSVPNLRRQLSLILPEPERSMFDIVRAEIDPIQHSLISAHITLCREDEIKDWLPIQNRLSSLSYKEFSISFDSPICRNDNCILLPHNSSSTQYSELREYLLQDTDIAVRQSMAHITLFHPRNKTGKTIIVPKFHELDFPIKIRFDTVSLIEQICGQAWQELNNYPLCVNDL